MTSSVHASILTRLGLVIYEQVADGTFLQILPPEPPPWLRRARPDADRNVPVAIASVFPFLDRFLSEARRVWTEDVDGRLRSEPFVVDDPEGGEVAIVAMAVAADARSFLVLEPAPGFDDLRRMLQSAREQALAHEDFVRRTGALLPAVAEARQLVKQLAATGLGTDQQQLAQTLGARLEGLASSIEALAPLPKGVARRPQR